MKAIVQRAYGSGDVLRVADIEPPEPGPREVLVRVRAASINHADAALTTGQSYLMRSALTPRGILVLSSGTGGRVLGPLGRYLRALLLSPLVGQRLRVHAARPSHED